jgi:hypothetical protein
MTVRTMSDDETGSGDDFQSFDPSDLFLYLQGRWQIARRVDDRREDAVYHMQGTGAFDIDPEASAPRALVYQEEVVWQPAGEPQRGLRSYRYRFDGPTFAQVLFADGSPFHELDLASGMCTVGHDCPPDRYDGLYHLLDRDTFEVRWTVVGPRKDMILATSFHRIA